MKNKGISLPIETIVIVAVVVLVLVVIVTFFVTGTAKPITTIQVQQAVTSGCTDLVVRFECDASKIPDINIPGFEGGMEKACELTGYPDNVQCAQVQCRCP